MEALSRIVRAPLVLATVASLIAVAPAAAATPKVDYGKASITSDSAASPVRVMLRGHFTVVERRRRKRAISRFPKAVPPAESWTSPWPGS
jgi:hypothetical protein